MNLFLSTLFFVLLLGTNAFAQEESTCNGTCVPDSDMQAIGEVLRERKCLQSEKPKFELDSINVVVDKDGRVFYSGAAPHPYKLKMTWCHYDVTAEGRVNIVAATQEPPSYGVRFRPKAYLGMLLLEPLKASKGVRDGLDAGLMVDLFYIHDFNLNVHAGLRSVGAGVGLDIFKSFGLYVGYALAWDGFAHNPEASLWFSFW